MKAYVLVALGGPFAGMRLEDLSIAPPTNLIEAADAALGLHGKLVAQKPIKFEDAPWPADDSHIKRYISNDADVLCNGGKWKVWKYSSSESVCYWVVVIPTLGERFENTDSGTTGEESKDGCFIATACYGGVDAPQVLVLRRFRDEALLSSRWGRRIVAVYYWLSPPVAQRLSRHPVITKCIRRLVLDPLAVLLLRSQQR